jgi:type VI secretion system protein ImpJ
MKFLSRVVWSEGMHLGPHHFQAQSRYFEDTLWFLNAYLHQEPWGFLHFSIDAAALRNGVATLSYASGILPDGLIFDLPDCDAPPQPLPLDKVFTPTDSEVLLYLGIPKRHDDGTDCNLSGDSSARYSATQKTVRDDAYGNGEYNVSFAHKNLILLSQAQVTEDVIAFPIARIQRDGKGGFMCDPDYIAPCLRIAACENLVLLLHNLAHAIEEKIASTRAVRGSARGFELGTSALDVANYWFIHALSASLPSLRHHLADRRSHPEDVYRDLARMAGALGTFAVQSRAEEIPPYRHGHLTATFAEMDALIRKYLEIVAPSNTVTLDFKRSAQYIYSAPVLDERCLRRSRWIFGIRSSLTESMLLRQTPQLVKICSAEGVGKLVQRALPGMELMHVPVPPSAMRAQADMHYFSVSLAGPCWQHILQTKQVGVYLPGDLGNAEFDLTVILEASS